MRLGFSFAECILVRIDLVKYEDRNTVGALSKLLSEKDISEVIEMALSDHVSFSDILNLHGLREAEVKLLMRKTLKVGSYRAWRKRVHDFGSRRAHYK